MKNKFKERKNSYRSVYGQFNNIHSLHKRDECLRFSLIIKRLSEGRVTIYYSEFVKKALGGSLIDSFVRKKTKKIDEIQNEHLKMGKNSFIARKSQNGQNLAPNLHCKISPMGGNLWQM